MTRSVMPPVSHRRKARMAARRHDDQVDICPRPRQRQFAAEPVPRPRSVAIGVRFRHWQARFQSVIPVKARLGQDAIDRPAFATGSDEGKILGIAASQASEIELAHESVRFVVFGKAACRTPAPVSNVAKGR